MDLDPTAVSTDNSDWKRESGRWLVKVGILTSAKSFAWAVNSVTRIGTMDLRIASIALARGFTLLTRNLVDFERVPRLAVEDLTRS